MFLEPQNVWIALQIADTYKHKDTEGVKYNKQITSIKSSIEHTKRETKFATKAVIAREMKGDIYHRDYHHTNKKITEQGMDALDFIPETRKTHHTLIMNFTKLDMIIIPMTFKEYEEVKLHE